MALPGLEAFIEAAPKISEDADYWFVRTQGGSLFEAFTASNSIAVNYSVPLKELPDAADSTRIDQLKRLVSRYYPKVKQPGFTANQLWIFCRVMKKGDFVLSPSYGTKRIALGIIDDDTPFERELIVGEKHYPEFRLRRKVRWVKTVERKEINPKLFAILFTHQAIVSAKSYATFIDTMYFDFFRKGDSVHFVMDVTRSGKINAHTLFDACSQLLKIVDDIAEGEDLPENSSELSTRINLNSPGIIEFVGIAAGVVAILALVVTLVNGGKAKLKFKDLLDVEIGSEGLIPRISDYLDAKSERELTKSIREKLETLKVENPETVLAMLEKRRGKNKK